ncbi:DUF1839 family protein [Aquisphaera insulae]|uniref:DUF1839 family protein n=1 Tax=Aquisphaera insulae TaxID=2712864 RepID=UPI0013EAD76F|nr:DUF1839 family protein [Aquisphaera insulae]
MNPKERAILERINTLEEAITRGREYLESGAHADWHGFRPVFVPKTRDGKPVPPHRDWVRNVFLPAREKALRDAERLLERHRPFAGAAGPIRSNRASLRLQPRQELDEVP